MKRHLTTTSTVFIALTFFLPTHSLRAEFIWAWGYNGNGQSNAPVGGDFTAVAGGLYHSLAIRSNGSIVGWGDNQYDQLNVPTGTFLAVAAGDRHSLALRSDGTLAAWGDNQYGQATAPEGGSFVAIAAGQSFNLALRSDGMLIGWGRTSFAPTGNDYVAAIPSALNTGVALKTDGSLVGWGELADTPTSSAFVAIGAGPDHAVALAQNGSIEAWGNPAPQNDHGQHISPQGGDFSAVVAGERFSIALRDDGSLVAWGYNGLGACNVPSGSHFVAIGAGPSAHHGLALSTVPVPEPTTAVLLGLFGTVLLLTQRIRKRQVAG